MSEIVKHVGMITNTGKRCAIVFLQIPGKEDHALVVDTEALPDRIHDPIMNIIKTTEAQQAQNLGEVLARRMMPDSGRNVLEELHVSGYLQSQPVTNVMVVPRPNTRVVLSEMLEAMGRLNKERLSQGISNPNEVQSVIPDMVEPVSNLFDDNRQFSNNEEAENVARGMLTQAELMENDAAQLRAKAYKMAPSLAPKASAPKVEAKKPETKPAAKVSSAKTSTPAKGSKVEPKTTGNNSKNSRGKTASA